MSIDGVCLRQTTIHCSRRWLRALVLPALGGYGLPTDNAVHAVRGLRTLVHGFASLEAAGGFGLPLDRDESFRQLITTFVSGLEQAAGKNLMANG